MRLALAALLLATGSLPAQQLLDARNDNPSYGSYAVGWPSNVIAFRFTAPANTTLAAAQVFTGNQAPATHSLEIRTRDAITGLPSALVGLPGAWTTSHARCWQGATFAQGAPLQAGQDYFLVWRVQGMFPQHSVSADTEPANVLVETRYSDGNTWHATGQVPAKFRLFVAYAAGPISAYGTGKPGQYGNPTIGVSGWPALGTPIDVWLDDAARNVLAVLVLGVPIPGGVSVGFADVFVTPDVLVALVTKSHTSPFVGGANFSLYVPNDPTWVGFPLSFQWGVFDPLAVDGFAHSSAATALVQ